VRNLVGLPLALLWTAALSFLALLAWPLSPSGRLQNAVVRLWAKGLLALAGLRIDVTGREHLRGGPFVVVANHASALDIPALAALLPFQFRFVSRPLFFKIPFLGWGMLAAGQIALDPRRPRNAAKALPKIGARLRRGASVILFPEGTRTRDGRLQRYRRGPFLVAIENAVPVLPVCLDGLFEAMEKGSLRVRPGRIAVEIGAPVPTAGMSREQARALAERVEAWTRAAKERLRARA
jgi:1-acyl-sn-glycerol-3-phosphate acyltransferase